MADTFARVGDAVVGYAVTGTSDMPDFSGDHFTWEGHCWEAVTDPGLLVATMDPAASPAAKEALTARIVQAMSVATKKLVVTEEAILNHATLIGQTVVDDINVQGKLIGTDGVFTGTVDFENINVTDEVLASRISGEHIYGTVIEGGLFKTSDDLPGQVELADDAYVTHLDGGGTFPGLRVVPTDTSETNLPAAIGPSVNGLTIFGGRSISGGSSIVQCNPGGSFLRTFRPDGSRGGTIQTSPEASFVRTYRKDGSVGGTIQASPEGSFMQTLRADGSSAGSITVTGTFTSMVTNGAGNAAGMLYANSTSAHIRTVDANNVTTARLHADATESYIYSRAGGSQRYLTVDSTGVWVKTNKSGSWEWWNLEETASDTGWRTFPMNSALAGAGSPAYRIKSGTVFLRGSVTLPGANWSGGWTTIGVLPAAATPTFDVQRPTVTSAMSQVPETYLQTNTSGQFQVWIPRSVEGTTVIQLSPMSYVAG